MTIARLLAACRDVIKRREWHERTVTAAEHCEWCSEYQQDGHAPDCIFTELNNIFASLPADMGEQEYVIVPRELVECFVDKEPCWFDHHGYCQEHGWTSTPCGMAELRACLDQQKEST